MRSWGGNVFFEVLCLPRRIKRALMFEYSEGDPQHFVHERTDNAHLTFPGGLHALSFGP